MPSPNYLAAAALIVVVVVVVKVADVVEVVVVVVKGFKCLSSEWYCCIRLY